MVVGIILLILGAFFIFIAATGVNDYNLDGNNSSSAAQIIIMFFIIGVVLALNGGSRIDDYIWPSENKTGITLER